MRKIFLLPVVLFFLTASCNKTPSFRIRGTVPDSDFEGSRVYLVALDAPVTRNVDSTTVLNGAFEFTVPADSFDVRILRIPARFPSIVEDLVVVCEPGEVIVILDSISSGGGTRLNNILQQWKENKYYHDSLQWIVAGQIRSAGNNQGKIDSLKAESQRIGRSMLSESISLLNGNLFNGVGLLIYKVYFDDFPAEVKNYVTRMTGRLYLEKDAQIRARFE
ncbi:MAG: DUF4369 domain-containing protein [Bacteroidales bacterium]